MYKLKIKTDENRAVNLVSKYCQAIVCTSCIILSILRITISGIADRICKN